MPCFSFLYTLLTNEVASALETVGLDPYVGFLHPDRPGAPRWPGPDGRAAPGLCRPAGALAGQSQADRAKALPKRKAAAS